MSVGLILLSVVSALILFGVAQRVLDKMQLTDRAAILMAAAIFFGGFLPDIRLGNVAINVGGALVPLGICVYLLIRADTKKEVIRALLGSLATAIAVFALGKLLPDEPEKIFIDPNYVYGIAGGIIAWLLGRSRRAAFICGVLGVIGADALVGIINLRRGIHQTLVLGGAGAMDVVVISGLLAVLLCELTGEIMERIARAKGKEKNEDVHIPFEKGGNKG